MVAKACGRLRGWQVHAIDRWYAYWMPPRTRRRRLALDEFSRAMRRIFRRWLRDRSVTPGAPKRRCGALLHDRRSLRWASATKRSRPWSTRRPRGPKLDRGSTPPIADPRFQRLRRLMEDEWTLQLTSLLNIPRHDLPMIWDADFMLGTARAPTGRTATCLARSTSVQCSRSPTRRPAAIARRVADRLRNPTL